MEKTDTLFTRKAFDEVKDTDFTVERKEKVVYNYFVTVCGEKFDLNDLYNTLIEAERGDIVITNEKMVKVLKKIGVLEYEGNRRACWGARVGVNYDEFLDMVRGAYKDKDRMYG